MSASKINRRESMWGFLFLLPNLIGFVLFSLIPVVVAFVLSLTDWDGISKINFMWFENYIDLFKDESFRIALYNTFIYTIAFVPLTLFLGLMIAMLLNNKLKGIGVYRLIYFIPYIASAVAISYVFSALLHPTLGPINNMLRSFGIDNPPQWLTSPNWAMFSVIVMSVWKNFGYYVVMFLAGLQGVPSSLYEAATIDGAGGWNKFKHITIPLITPVTFFCIIMATINSFKVFDQVYILTEGGPGRATTTIVQYIYESSFQNYQMGYASAAAVVLFGIIFIVTLVQYRGQNKWVNY
ncbi:sugar ABC transporter permease [Paenibacillus sp. FSL K6-0276]|uniref:carbohydrate ABC transporter permease n=1 Tax=unclassified Paenibacillus TaxID=185978 RepID=UPI0028A9A1E8|nr:sugar ABC transporter permease [Paenibacillus sp.]